MSRGVNALSLKIRLGQRYSDDDSRVMNIAKDTIDNARSIDLVTCAECRFKRLYDGETKYYYCALEDRPNRQWSVDDWNYCYWGERKENE